MNMRVVVIIPTFNELENLPIILGRLFKSNPEVSALIVDDASPDGTGELADQLAALAAAHSSGSGPRAVNWN